MMKVLRDYSGIDYSDIELRGETDSCFFPGCTLMTYAPALTRHVYDVLKKSGACGGMAVKCCGKPLTQLGLTQRAGDAACRLLAHFRAHKVRELIVACPGCYYELRTLLSPAGIRLRTVYETLGPATAGAGDDRVYAVHDSCPDRFEGIFGRQVRERLAASGFKLTELAHSGKDSLCCGSGGMVSHFRPDLAEGLVGGRLAEARQAGADVLVSYCASCAAKFAGAAGGLETAHALGLLLGRREDFAAAKRRLAAILDGPDGAAIWARIMAD
jgi:Fe-S oxidoreductase